MSGVDESVHHIDQSDRSKCAVCGDLWPCLTFLAFIGGDVRHENMGHRQGAPIDGPPA